MTETSAQGDRHRAPDTSDSPDASTPPDGYPWDVPRLRLAVLALAAMLIAGACGGTAPSSGAVASVGASTPAPAATDAPASTGDPSATDDPAATDEPTPTDDPAATDDPAPTDDPAATDDPAPTDDPAATDEPEPTDSPSTEPSTADACSGSDANREFFDSIARAVDWPVLCGVLPRGWFVDEGKYRLGSGGWLRIGYKGPGGASLWLYQGAACTVNGGCSPTGTNLGVTALGPLEGTLFETSDGFAILAAPGENPSWYLTTSGLDQATTVRLAGALAEVGG